MNRTQNKNGKRTSKYLVLLASILFLMGSVNVDAFASNHTLADYNQLTEQQSSGFTVTGLVTDQQGETMIGVSILEKGTSNGTITQANGRFSLQVESANSVLVFSYIGYAKQEITVGNVRDLKVVLAVEAKEVDEVVVIGYGTQRKGDITSAVASVKAEDFSVGKIGDAAELVKGKIAGLSITKSSGDPNATSSIMLRGITTIIGSVSPLVLVDGVEGSLTTVAPENIAAIDVLKDASAAAIYGTRGANGVIIITTKSGQRESRANVTYHAYGSLTNWYKKAEFMDTRDVIFARTNFPYDGYNTDWLDAVTRKMGHAQNHSISIDGAQNQQPILPTSLTVTKQALCVRATGVI